MRCLESLEPESFKDGLARGKSEKHRLRPAAGRIGTSRKAVLTRGPAESLKTEKGQYIGCESGDGWLVAVAETADADKKSDLFVKQ